MSEKCHPEPLLSSRGVHWFLTIWVSFYGTCLNPFGPLLPVTSILVCRLGLSVPTAAHRGSFGHSAARTLRASVPPQTSSPAGPGCRGAQPRPRSRGRGEMPERAARPRRRFHPDPGGGDPVQDLRGPDPEPSRGNSQINGVGGLG